MLTLIVYPSNNLKSGLESPANHLRPKKPTRTQAWQLLLSVLASSDLEVYTAQQSHYIPPTHEGTHNSMGSMPSEIM